MSRKSGRLRSILATIIGLTVCLTGFGGSAAADRSGLAAQPAGTDLCTLLPASPGLELSPGIGKPGSTLNCEVVNKGSNPKFELFIVERFETVAEAQKSVQVDYDSWRKSREKGGGPSPFTNSAFGDEGLGFEQPPWPERWNSTGEGPRILFSRGCFKVLGSAGWSASNTFPPKFNDPAAMYEIGKNLDHVLPVNECPDTSGAQPTGDYMRFVFPDSAKDCPLKNTPAIRVQFKSIPPGVAADKIPVLIQDGNDPSKTHVEYRSLKQPFTLFYGQRIHFPKQYQGWELQLIEQKAGVKVVRLKGANGGLDVPCDRNQPAGLLGGVADTWRTVKGGAQDLKDIMKVAGEHGLTIDDWKAGEDIIGPIFNSGDNKPKKEQRWWLPDPHNPQRTMALASGLQLSGIDPAALLRGPAHDARSPAGSGQAIAGYDYWYTVDAQDPASVKVAVYAGSVLVSSDSSAFEPLALDAQQTVVLDQNGAGEIGSIAGLHSAPGDLPSADDAAASPPDTAAFALGSLPIWVWGVAAAILVLLALLVFRGRGSRRRAAYAQAGWMNAGQSAPWQGSYPPPAAPNTVAAYPAPAVYAPAVPQPGIPGSPTPFQSAEQEYARLRSALVAGQVAQPQVTAALWQMIVRDAQGRSWMIDGGSGQWMVYDGRQWVYADPYRRG